MGRPAESGGGGIHPLWPGTWASRGPQACGEWVQPATQRLEPSEGRWHFHQGQHPSPFPAAALQATRALMVVSLVLGFLATFVATMGMKCTNCGGDDKVKKARTAMAGGIIFILAGEQQVQGGPKYSLLDHPGGVRVGTVLVCRELTISQSSFFLQVLLP